jgi:hypothetical protein
MLREESRKGSGARRDDAVRAGADLYRSKSICNRKTGWPAEAISSRRNDGSSCLPRACREIRDGTTCRLMKRICLLHRSLEPAGSKKNSDTVATLQLTVASHYSRVHCSLYCLIFDLLFCHRYSVRVYCSSMPLLQVRGFEYVRDKVRHATVDGSRVKVVA